MDLAFSGTVWAPLASFSERKTAFYTNEPDAIRATYRADITSSGGPITVGTISEVDTAEFVPTGFCDDLFRIIIPLDQEVFYLELDADFIEGDREPPLLVMNRSAPRVSILKMNLTEYSNPLTNNT